MIENYVWNEATENVYVKWEDNNTWQLIQKVSTLAGRKILCYKIWSVKDAAC